MSNVQTTYGAQGVAIVCSVANLATNTARASTSVDNTTNEYLDALVQLVLKSGAASVVSTGFVNVYAIGTTDGGTTWPEGATGTDGAVTLTVPPNARLIGVINMVANATTYKSEPMSVAAAFGGVLPQKWAIIIENQSGGAFDSTEGNHTKQYQGVGAQVV